MHMYFYFSNAGCSRREKGAKILKIIFKCKNQTWVDSVHSCFSNVCKSFCFKGLIWFARLWWVSMSKIGEHQIKINYAILILLTMVEKYISQYYMYLKYIFPAPLTVKKTTWFFCFNKHRRLQTHSVPYL